MQYTVSYTQATSHFLDISLQISSVTENRLSLQLPSWRPGRYELQNFAKNIFSIEAFGGSNKPLPLEQVSKDRWVIDCKNTAQVQVRYRYYANQMDGGGTYLDEAQLYINWITCAFLVEERPKEAIDIALHLPADYHIACALPQQQHQLHALDFEQLVDSPLIASAGLQHESYQEGNCLFHIWIQGDCQPDWERLLADFKAFSKVQIEAFGSFPCEEYYFLLQILPYRHYHGVEHKFSTVIVLGPSEDLMGKLYDDLLGVSSHELYHTWNVTRLRPKEMVPYQWHTYNHFQTGFVAEGVTTYYGDLMLARGGVWDSERYLQELNVFLKRHFENPARHTSSLAGSSYELWLDGYSPRQPKRTVSIYVKGALIALLLDWKIRKATEGKNSLDDLMNRLWQKCETTGYTLSDYKGVVESFLGKQDTDAYFEQCVFGTVDLMPLLKEAGQWMGVTIETVDAKLIHEQKYGIRLQKKKEGWVVHSIDPKSPAMEQLSLGDELIAINNKRVTHENLEQLLNLSDTVDLHFFRNNILKNERLVITEDSYFRYYEISVNNKTEGVSQGCFQEWLS